MCGYKDSNKLLRGQYCHTDITREDETQKAGLGHKGYTYPRHKRLTPEPRRLGADLRTADRPSVPSSRPPDPQFLLVCGSAHPASGHLDGAGLQYSLLKNTPL